jgi:hypothetical protein
VVVLVEMVDIQLIILQVLNCPIESKRKKKKEKRKKKKEKRKKKKEKRNNNK